MPIVHKTWTVKNSNDPAQNQIPEGERAIYLDMLLSDYYGKMVRQGNSFCINGIQASLRPFKEAAGIDVGMSAEVGIDYVPTTQHSKQAWRNVFKGWSAQKKLTNAMGSQIRYDDLEFGWNDKEGKNRQRTSTIQGTGLNDTSAEKLTLTGVSAQTSGTTVGIYSLQDYYNSAYETPAASRDPFTNSNIKDPKWGSTPFPNVETMRCSATNSAGWFDKDGGIPGPGLLVHQNAVTQNNWANLPSNSHSLCGVLYASAFIMPDDTAASIEDEFLLTISISVKSWKSLTASPKRTYRARRMKPSNRAKGVKRGRYYGRRKRRY
ncbi:MAG: putative capsid protein [Cressdnaviricota sp.]|nr:MAG: putative capsid protein [Cressdnaviricota sp.]